MFSAQAFIFPLFFTLPPGMCLLLPLWGHIVCCCFLSRRFETTRITKRNIENFIFFIVLTQFLKILLYRWKIPPLHTPPFSDHSIYVISSFFLAGFCFSLISPFSCLFLLFCSFVLSSSLFFFRLFFSDCLFCCVLHIYDIRVTKPATYVCFFLFSVTCFSSGFLFSATLFPICSLFASECQPPLWISRPIRYLVPWKIFMFSLCYRKDIIRRTICFLLFLL